jgi:hypothetical protein
MVEIYKGHPSGFYLEWFRFTRNVPLLVTFPPRSNMRKGFKECEGDLFTIEIFWDKIITFYKIQPFF